jgi:MFS family permease
LIIFAFVRSQPMSLIVLVGVGAAMILQNNLNNALMQTLTPDALRGRVMAIYSLVFFGFMPIGALLAGGAAERIGEPNTVIAGAVITLAIALALYIFVPRVRQLE